jgi:hypothetical protein
MCVIRLIDFLNVPSLDGEQIIYSDFVYDLKDKECAIAVDSLSKVIA